MTAEAFDKYISARVCIPRGNDKAYGTVVRRTRDSDGNLIGKSNDNPLLDTALYDVRFPGGDTEAYTANIIAENIYAQVDAEGYTYYSLDEIIDHRKDSTAVSGVDAYEDKYGKKVLKRTTRGWKLCIRLKDGSTMWIALKDVKESNPIETAKYAVANGLDKEPAFAWWVHHTLKKRNRILNAMKKRYFRRHQKFGIEIPKTITRALEIDQRLALPSGRMQSRRRWKRLELLSSSLMTTTQTQLERRSSVTLSLMFGLHWKGRSAMLPTDT